MPSPHLDIIFFDLDDTLYSTTAFSLRARRAAVRAMIEAGLQVTEEEGTAELDEVVSEFTSNYPHHFGRLLDRLGRERYPDRNPAVLVASGVVAYHNTKREGMQLLPDVRPVLEAIVKASIRMGVISAGLQVKQAEKLIRLGALRYFDPTAIFFSDQMGVSKPNPKIFTKACEAAGVDPDRALYVGDRGGHDVIPARRAGLHAVHYTGALGKYHLAFQDDIPHHQISDLADLLVLLRERYGMPV